MKIAIIAHLKFPIAEPFAGGLEMLTHALVKQLKNNGHEVDLFACPGSDASLGFTEINTKMVDCKITAEVPPDHPDFTEQFIQSHHCYLDIMLRIQQGNYDIVHNNSLHYIPITMARTLDIPMVTTIHVPPFPFLQSATIASRKHPNNYYVTISQHTADTWRPFIGDSKVIYNGVDTKFWSYQASPTNNTAVWFGRICAEKAPHYALEAAKKAGVFLYFAGNMSDRTYFETKVRPLLNPAHNKFLGHLTQKEMRAYFHKADVFLFTSTWNEPYGLVLAESLSCGTPVAAFNSGAAPEIIRKGTGFIVEKEDVDGLTKAIIKCQALNPKTCRLHALEHCNINSMVSNYEAYYHQLIQEYQHSKQDLIKTNKTLAA